MKPTWTAIALTYLRRLGRWQTAVEISAFLHAEQERFRGQNLPMPMGSIGIACDVNTRLRDLERRGEVRGLRLGRVEGVKMPVLWRVAKRGEQQARPEPTVEDVAATIRKHVEDGDGIASSCYEFAARAVLAMLRKP